MYARNDKRSDTFIYSLITSKKIIRLDILYIFTLKDINVLQ